MNYSHAFHAGNFADLVKHAALLAVLRRLQAGPGALTVIDTHGGRGVYDLDAPEARRSAEAELGVTRLLGDPAPPDPVAGLREAVLAAGQGAKGRRYPGSPRLAADRLRPGDRLVVFELNPAEAAFLRAAVGAAEGVAVRSGDGFEAAPGALPGDGWALVLIDPPFERPDDYDRILETLGAITRRSPSATVMIWLPVKDLETLDAFIRRAEDIRPVLVAEARLKPLRDPMRMNGCALVVAAAPEGLDSDLEAICGWTVSRLGDGGQARVWNAG